MAIPAVDPLINWNFAKARKLDNRITFGRSSVATYDGPDGLVKTAAANEARFAFDSDTRKPLGLLIEQASTNLVPYSEDFGNAAWTKVGSTTVTVGTSDTTAPDGTNGASKITSASEQGITVTATATNGQMFCVSIWVKAGTATQYRHRDQGNDHHLDVNLTTGVVSVSDAGVVGGAIKYRDGWWRVWMVYAAGVGNVSINARPSDSGTTNFYLWGSQIEQVDTLTSYIKTTGATASRVADSAIVSGTNFSTWFNPREGAFVATVAARAGSAANRAIFSANDGTTNERYSGYFQDSAAADGAYFVVTDNSVAQASIATANSLATGKACGCAYALNDFSVVCAGGTAVVDTAGTLPSPNRLEIGTHAGAAHLNGTLARLAYFPKRLADAELQTLTT